MRMAEIDLIPSDYRTRLWLDRCVRWFVLAIGALLILTAGCYAALGHAMGKVKVEIEDLQAQQEISTRQREQLAHLKDKKTQSERQLALLKGLRSGAAAKLMFVTIDRSLEDSEVWFLNWEFQRAGAVVEHEPETVNTGYFIVLPSTKSGKSQEAWKIDTHMSINGQAQDHSALSRFVSRLLAQPEIQDVHVLSTALRKYANSRVVEFRLAVIVNTGVMSG